jgi:hypothetical protein
MTTPKTYNVFQMNYTKLGGRLVFTHSTNLGQLRLEKQDTDSVLFALLKHNLAADDDAIVHPWPGGHLSVQNGSRRFYELAEAQA